MTTRGEINSNFYQIVNVDANGAPTSVKSQYLPNVSNANTANFANYAGNAFSVNIANVVGIGNIATINLSGNGSQVLLGNGTFGNGGGNGNATNIQNGNSNVTVPVSNGNIYINANAGTNKQWNFDTTGNIKLPGNGIIGDVYNDGGVGIKAPPGSNYSILASDDLDQYVQVDNTSVFIGTNFPANNHVWEFKKNGNTTFPGGTSVNLGNLATANFFSGNGSLLTGIIANNVANANYANFAGNATTSNTVTANAQPNITSVGTLTTLTSSGNVTAPYFLGNVVGNISGNIVVPGLQWNVLYNNNGNAGASNNFLFDANSNVLTVTGNINANNFIGNISVGNVVGLGNIATLNLNGSNSQVLYGNGVFASVGNGDYANNANFANFAGNAFNVSGSNVSGQVGNALLASRVYTNAQPNITSVGTLTTLTVSGNITANNANLGNLTRSNFFSGSGNLLSNIQAANISGVVANATYATSAGSANIANTVTINAQPNITSVGTLTSLNVTGNITGGNANLGNLVIANYFNGNGSLLTSINGSNVTGVVANATYAVSAGNATTSDTANTAGTVTTNAQPNITSVGTLISLNVTGNIKSGNANLGNLTVSNFFSGNGSLLTNVTSNYANFAGNAFSVDGANVSGAVAYATVANSVAGANVSGAVNLANYATTANNIAGSNVSGAVANATYSITAGTVVANNQPNITGVGTLTSLSITGNLSSGNANLGNSVIANYHIGNLYGTANLAIYATTANAVAGGNVSGQVGNALVSGTVYSNAQPNITSVGTLTTLSVTGNISSGNANLGNLLIANFYSGNGNLLSNIQGANISGQVGNALIASTVYTNAQPNITSVGTLTSLTVSGISNLNSVSNVIITGGIANYVLSTNGSGNLSWVAQTGGGGSTATDFVPSLLLGGM